jgi:hypothetical protein
MEKLYISIQGGDETQKTINFGGKLSFTHPVFPFFLSASTADTHIFTDPNYTTTIISLNLCALNAEFQHFILRFNKNVFTLRIPLKEGIGG